MSHPARTVPRLPPQTFTPSSFLPQQRDAPVLSAGLSRSQLIEAYGGLSLATIRTPAAILDLRTVRKNCERMLDTSARQWHVAFRAHVKTHKTPQITLLQLAPHAPLVSDQPPASASASTTDRLVVSTLPEAWGIISSSDDNGFVRDQLKHYVNDILYSLPLPLDKLEELFQLRLALRRFSSVGTKAQLRLMVDNVAQVEVLEAYMQVRSGSDVTHMAGTEDNGATAVAGASIPFGLTKEEKALGGGDPWPVFIKIDSGGRRAGLGPSSPEQDALLHSLVHNCPHVSIYGFYAHAGQSYASKTAEEADAYLQTELDAASNAARQALQLLSSLPSRQKDRHTSPFVLSVGSTPTAHAALARARANQTAGQDLAGTVELHAGNYPFLDLQQVATNVIPTDSCGTPDCSSTSTPVHDSLPTGKGQSVRDVALSVLSSVVSTYPFRSGGGEALCDAGGIAMSKDTGPFGSYGHVISPPEAIGWCIARPSQEHGMLARRPGSIQDWQAQWAFPSGVVGRSRESKNVTSASVVPFEIGSKLRIVPQHACMTAAQYPWFYVVDSGLGAQDDRAWWTLDWAQLKIIDIYIPWKFW